MGRDERQVRVLVTCLVSRHNSPQDASDDALVEELRQRIHDAVGPIVRDPRYDRIIVWRELSPADDGWTHAIGDDDQTGPIAM